mmetsp:Transcript_15639/g.36547  ORF Transcript_15639/g.36547 Transcript_15639/m.36547 type:complete len:243 (-) Transcript_15639:47-775(-)
MRGRPQGQLVREQLPMALQDDVAAMAKDKDSMDAELQVADSAAPVRAHRFILMARSPVLRCMFEHDLAERRTGRVHVMDATLAAVRALVHFCYTDELDAAAPAEDVVPLADKYQLTALLTAAEASLVSCVSEEKVVPLTRLCARHALPKLEEAIAAAVRGMERLSDREDVKEMFRVDAAAGLKLLQLATAKKRRVSRVGDCCRVFKGICELCGRSDSMHCSVRNCMTEGYEACSACGRCRRP